METMTKIPRNPGSVVRNKSTGNIYTLDANGVWHGPNQIVDKLHIWTCLRDFPQSNEVLSWGVEPRVEEPQGLGAVVDVEYDDGTIIRWVRVNTDSTAGACWRATGGGLASWGWWEDGKLAVRHEGWNEQ